MTQKKVILILSFLLGCTSLLAVYGFISKGNATPAVALILKGEEEFGYAAIDSFNNARFWDNYPYWVIMSERKKIEPETIVTFNDQNIKLDELTHKGNIFLRIDITQMDNVLLDTILSAIIKTDTDVTILTNMASAFAMKKSPGYQLNKIQFAVLDVPFSLAIEKSHLPYFFTLNPDFTVNNIYVPRKETPGVLSKYLSAMKTNVP